MSPKHRMVAGFFTEMDFERVPKVCNSFSTTDALWKVFSQFWLLVFWISGSRQAFGLLFFVCWFFHLKSERRVQGRLPRMNCHTHWCRLPDVSDRWTWLRRVRVEQGRRQPLSSPCWVGWMSVRTTLRSVTPGWGSCLPACPCLSVCLSGTWSLCVCACLSLGHYLSCPVCVSPSICTCQPLSVFWSLYLSYPVCLSASVSHHLSVPVSPCLSLLLSVWLYLLYLACLPAHVWQAALCSRPLFKFCCCHIWWAPLLRPWT